MSRLPDFVIIGAMKAGTTTLFDRLGQVPGVTLPQVKEPHFFSDDDRWGRGVDWYQTLFEGCDGVTGEASASYSDASDADNVVDRMHQIVPKARIVFALRDPLARMRSHYRHQVLRSRERRPFDIAISDPSSGYVTRSLYGATLTSYRRKFDPEQIHLYRLEDLDNPNTGTWDRILDHLGLDPAPMPIERRNESALRPQFTPALLWLWERNLLPSRGLPTTLRRIGKRVLTRRPDARSRLLVSADAPVGDRILELLRSDQAVLEGLCDGSSVVSHEP
jgi:hypothetical protein